MSLFGTLSTRMAVRSQMRISWQTLMIIVLMIISWAGTFEEMWLRWFPAWQDVSLSLIDRLTQGDSYYLHGPLVPLVSLVLAIRIYKQQNFITSTSRKETFIGWMFFFGAIILHLLSVYARVTFLSGFALIGALAGLTILKGGWQLFRSYAAAILLLIFMVPLPMNAVAELNLELKMLAGKCAVRLVNDLFHIPAIIDGSFIFLSANGAGAPKQLVLEDVCSGLRSLIALTWFAAVFAGTCHVRTIWRIGFLVLAVPLAIGCNVLRIMALILAAHFYGIKTAGPEGWFHQLSGVLVFFLAIGVLIGIEKIILKYDRWREREPKVRQDVELSFRSCPAVIALMVFTAFLSVKWSLTVPPIHEESLAGQAAPMSFRIDGDIFQGQDQPVDGKTQVILETRDILYRRYTASQTLPAIDLLIVCSGDNRKGTHPPQVCLTGGGASIVSQQDRPLILNDGTVLPLRELISREKNVLKYHLYVYKCGKRYTPSFFRQQASIFMSGLLQRNIAGSMIRLSVCVNGEEIDNAREMAFKAAAAIWPALDGRLP